MIQATVHTGTFVRVFEERALRAQHLLHTRLKRLLFDQCWASYSNNVIYYSLLVINFKSNIVTLLITFWQQ